jgi:hypothetical protein
MIPMLAERWEILEGGHAWKFHLRRSALHGGRAGTRGLARLAPWGVDYVHGRLSRRRDARLRRHPNVNARQHWPW